MWCARYSTQCNINVLPHQIASIFSRGRRSSFAPLAAARTLGEQLDASLLSLLSSRNLTLQTDAFQRAAEWHELEIQVEELSAALTMPSLIGLVDEAAAKETQAAEVRCGMNVGFSSCNFLGMNEGKMNVTFLSSTNCRKRAFFADHDGRVSAATRMSSCAARATRRAAR